MNKYKIGQILLINSDSASGRNIYKRHKYKIIGFVEDIFPILSGCKDNNGFNLSWLNNNTTIVKTTLKNLIGGING